VRRIFGPKREKIVRGCKRLHNEELRNLYSSPDVIRVIKSRRMRRAGHVAHMEDMRNAYDILVGRPEGKDRRGKDNIRMDVRGKEGGIQLAQDRDLWRVLVNTVINLRVPQNAENF